jgi:tetrapyrrole methylase family protein/MazG family protein
MKFKQKRSLYLLKEIASILRGEEGCAWDRAQTSQTLKPYLIEEAYEVYDAIEKDDYRHLKEELGDLLYQIYAHAQIAEENNLFTIDDVAHAIIDKLIRRHPHVFGDEIVSNKEEVIEKWEKIKKREKSHRASILDGVPLHLPALLKAYRVQQKASRVGFDWDRIKDVLGKLDEEIDEFKDSIKQKDRQKIEEEIGDILFTITNISRFLEINPEEALSRTVDKFIRRFKFIEAEASKSGKEIEDMSLEELDSIWERSKGE